MTFCKLICGDNIDVLKGMKDETVDLIYIDPPFMTNENYEIIYGDNHERRAFDDRWEGGINHYIEWMRPRVQEMHRVLKRTGSFYLHCDWHADAYLRVMCDQIFGYGNLVNRICWIRTTSKGTSNKKFGVIHDVILWYSKTSDYLYRPQKEISKDLSGQYKKKDKRGYYRTICIVQAGAMAKSSMGQSRFFPSENKKVQLDENHGWKWTQDRIDAFVKDGGRFEWSSNGIPSYVKYLDDGQARADVWDGMYLHPSAKEKLGYPTQKPESLLELIIKASSNEGDTVADFFCGCGTTLAVAERLKRNCIGVDISPTALKVISERVKVPLDEVEGYPMTADELAKLKPFEFQNWVCNQMNAVISERKSGDMGIDGKCRITGFPIQVKQSKVGRPTVDTFQTAMKRAKSKKGSIVGLEFSRDAFEETARVKSEGLEIHLYTPEDLIKKKPFSDHVSAHGNVFDFAIEKEEKEE